MANSEQFRGVTIAVARSSFTNDTNHPRSLPEYAQLRTNEITFTRARASVVPACVIKISIRFGDINSLPARATILTRRLTSLHKVLRVLRRAATRGRIKVMMLVHFLTHRDFASAYDAIAVSIPQMLYISYLYVYDSIL